MITAISNNNYSTNKKMQVQNKPAFGKAYAYFNSSLVGRALEPQQELNTMMSLFKRALKGDFEYKGLGSTSEGIGPDLQIFKSKDGDILALQPNREIFLGDTIPMLELQNAAKTERMKILSHKNPGDDSRQMQFFDEMAEAFQELIPKQD